MKKILAAFIVMICNPAYSQNFPIYTVYDNKQVVIMTLESSNSINKLIDDQNVKITKLNGVISKKNDEISDLREENKLMVSKLMHQIDSLSQKVDMAHSIYGKCVAMQDSLETRISMFEQWISKAAINNCLLYADRSTNRVKYVDFSKYNLKLGIFSKYRLTHSTKDSTKTHKIGILNDVDNILYRRKVQIEDCQLIKSISWEK